MSDLAVTRSDVKKIRAAAYRVKDRCVDADGNITDPETDAQMELLAEFCDVLLGNDTVDGFLRSQDMED